MAVDVAAIAEDLSKARRDGAPIPPVVERYPEISVQDAYRIQFAGIDARLRAGARRCGWKVGLTSKAMQETLGVGEPDFGHLLDDMVVGDGASVPAGRLCAPRAEPEVVFILRQTLEGPDCTAENVLAATGAIAPGIEVVDSRIADWRVTLADTVADNASSAAVRIGDARGAIADLDVASLGVRLTKNGEVVEEGSSAAVLGNPAAAVAWLANKLSELGRRIEAGEFVFPGACTKAMPVQSGDFVEAEFEGLGRVSVTFT